MMSRLPRDGSGGRQRDPVAGRQKPRLRRDDGGRDGLERAGSRTGRLGAGRFTDGTAIREVAQAALNRFSGRRPVRLLGVRAQFS